MNLKNDYFQLQEIRAPLVVVSDGYYSKLSLEYRKTHTPVSDDLCIAVDMKDYKFKTDRKFLEFSCGDPRAQVVVYQLNDQDIRGMFLVKGQTPSNLKGFCEHEVIPYAPGNILRSKKSSSLKMQ